VVRRSEQRRGVGSGLVKCNDLEWKGRKARLDCGRRCATIREAGGNLSQVDGADSAGAAFERGIDYLSTGLVL